MRTDDICSTCGSDDTDLGRHPTLDGAWWHCYICGHTWPRTTNPDGSLIALSLVDGTKVPLEESCHVSPSALKEQEGQK
jgi:hypothetical protein